jgi:hypothetical protein
MKLLYPMSREAHVLSLSHSILHPFPHVIGIVQRLVAQS